MWHIFTRGWKYGCEFSEFYTEQLFYILFFIPEMIYNFFYSLFSNIVNFTKQELTSDIEQCCDSLGHTGVTASQNLDNKINFSSHNQELNNNNQELNNKANNSCCSWLNYLKTQQPITQSRYPN